MYLAYDRNQWWAVVNKVMNLSGFLKGGKCLGQLSGYQLLSKDSFIWRWLNGHLK
jgi:hypothetical protein